MKIATWLWMFSVALSVGSLKIALLLPRPIGSLETSFGLFFLAWFSTALWLFGLPALVFGWFLVLLIRLTRRDRGFPRGPLPTSHVRSNGVFPTHSGLWRPRD